MSATDARNVERVLDLCGLVSGIGAFLLVAAAIYPAAHDLIVRAA